MRIMSSDLELTDLTKRYGTMTAVDNVTMKIKGGEMIALLGPSGCGKSTTLRMIAGLVEQTSGDIAIGGRSISNVPVHLRNIGMLFQNYALFPHLSVAQNLAFGLEMRRIDKAEIGRRVGEALDLVQLGRFADRPPAALSGGQQQRVALARSLVIEPSILLLDEPLGALDKSLREDMQFELRSLQRKLGITTVMVTHDQDEAQTLADRVVVMNAGSIEQIGAPDEVYSRPVSRFVAGFIGAGNFLDGHVLGRDGDQITIDAGENTRLTVSSVCAAAGGVTVLLRPETIDVSPRDGRDIGFNSLPAQIEQIIHRGPLVHLHLRTPEGRPIVAHRQSGRGLDLTPGDAVVASWSSHHNWLIPRL